MTHDQIVRSFWAAMDGNDYQAVADRFLSPGFIALWPLTGEVIEGRDAFAAVNAGFPGQGDWRFEEISLVGQNDRIATDIRVTNAPLNITARVLTFHELEGDFILRQTEFWPDPYPIPDWRSGMLRVDNDLARW
ncbi:nuclear transport factor 2 family protein [Paracoccus aerodenitrificans]|uniref:nuclear transport factor 2 family protein n=1 Tax=Paracoccus aerodenitrificans TaxID=3017781 RepID=UPI0022F0BA54|nr:nuclear transport factor 2 family protein [Paracoccus aerodenitrificans]WBU64147.1 nuclear transport factor 2 family protein [Paracoccus aerodenitrificans]